MASQSSYSSPFSLRRMRRRGLWRPTRKESADRQLRLEPLEDRVLLAVGPQLIGIQPNEGGLLEQGDVRHVAPQDLTFRFNEGQAIDPTTLDGIRITRSGLDGTFGDPNDVVIDPGYAGVNPDRANEVVVRFAETLPDDLYRIDVFGSGATPLRNTEGEPFNDGEDEQREFKLNLGAQVIAVVPQPVTRGLDGELTQARDQLVVYFNDDDLLDDATSAENPAFYQLIFTADEVANIDHVVHLPVQVDYSETTDTAVLTFASPLDELSTGPGTYRLRIGTAEANPLPPQEETTAADPGSSFDTATNLDDEFGFNFDMRDAKSILISSGIDAEGFPLDFPGANDEPGHREIPVETHLNQEADAEDGITTIYYNFKDVYGQDPQGNDLHNVITTKQKARARDIFELYGTYLGVQFVELEGTGPLVPGEPIPWVIVTGDLRAIDPTIPTGPGGVLGLAGVVYDPILDDFVPTTIMDNGEQWNDDFGATGDAFGWSDALGRPAWFETAMHEIGHLLGLGHTYDLPPLTIMGEEFDLTFNTPHEEVVPNDNDILHGQHLYRPESNDIDLYQFELTETGLFTAETIAERQTDSSLLDTVLTMYRQTDTGQRELIARNDDYYSEDSFLQLVLTPGVYYIGVTSTGNTAFDPTVEATGFGGTTQGPYDLRLGFRPEVTSSIVDADTLFDGVTPLPTPFDGDADGVPGGVYNFWFRTQRPFDGTNPQQPRTLFVDKSHTPILAPLGTLSNPYNRISTALDAANPGDIVRVVGSDPVLDQNDQVDLTASPAYEIGVDPLGQPLDDGAAIRVPKGVTMMIDAGAIFKLRRANFEIGSSSPTIDRSGGALQVVGTPRLLDEDGNLRLDGDGDPIVGSVYFTSFDDEAIGQDTNPSVPQIPQPGHWGGLIFRNDIDRSATPARFDYEREGIFLDYVNHADVRYGGGNVSVGSVEQVIAPIHMLDARPTASHNTITASADAAMSANPDSFEETNFHAPRYQDTPFTSDYDRVGPDIHGNRLVRQEGSEQIQNTINGLFVRISTPAGNDVEKMTVAGRWDDTDIVHVVKENLSIEGTQGGPTKQPVGPELTARLDARLAIDPGVTVKLDGARIETTISAQLIAEGVDGYRVVFTSVLDDRFGAGGTFDTTSDGQENSPAPGDWGGLYFGHTAQGSLDFNRLAFGGGVNRVEGGFAGFNVVEIHQADVRIAHSRLEQNAYGRGGESVADDPRRGGRGINSAGAIFVIGAQPSLIDNTITGTVGDRAGAITINVNSLNSELVTDWGRQTGAIGRRTEMLDNQGPLIRGNRLADNSVNGMVVRSGTLTTESVWDDTDIVHVIYDEIDIPDFHTYGGLRLESSPNESLVIKAWGEFAGFKTTGRAIDIDDRIGGMLHVVGQPGRPVVMTSLADDTVGAGFDPLGQPQNDTDNGGRILPTQPAGSFDIDLSLSPNAVANTRAVAAIDFAARYWEQLIEDPITVVLDIDLAELPDGVLGPTLSEFSTLNYSTVRSRMISDAEGRPNETIVSQLPSFSELNTIVPDDPANPFNVTSTMRITRANALALGFSAGSLPGPASAYDPLKIRDATIEMNIDTTMWDYDRSDGVLPGLYDFAGVVIHEIGHALGFISETGTVDRSIGDPAGVRDLQLNTLDLFRLQPGTGQTDFTGAARILDPQQQPHVVYDGGFFDPIDVPIPGLRIGDVPMSTGNAFGDGQQASHFKDDVQIGGVFLGMMDPTIRSDGYEVLMTEVDRQAFDLIGWDVVGGGLPGDWRGITLEQETHDRNVGVVAEREARDVTAPGNNATPDTAELMGALGSAEKATDDNQRLGFTVNGFLSAPADMDVYSFNAPAGTEVWFDIDRTTSNLDTVVELLDASGIVLARSDNSLAEGLGDEPLFAAEGVQVHGLQKSLLRPTDHWTVNPKDAGMRVVLPGSPGTHTYHVRVRSSSPDIDNLAGGLTSGVYQLQLRLRDIDEFAGATIEFADLRYANNAILVRGMPQHSPLTGETAEDGSPNDTLPISTLPMWRGAGVYRQMLRPYGPDPERPYEFEFQDIQQLGNVLNTDRAAIGVAGSLEPSLLFPLDVDWYQFDVMYDSIQQIPGVTAAGVAELIFDLDYADGLARPNTTVAIYEPIYGLEPDFYGNLEIVGAELIYINQDSADRDDLPGPLAGANTDDLSRGSVGRLDPMVGTVALLEGTYLLAISSDSQQPIDLDQFLNPLPNNPYIRLEPIDSIYRIAEDHIGQPILFPPGPTVYEPPQVPILFDDPNLVPFHLGDVVLFVSRPGDGAESTEVATVDPFTGFQETTVGQFDSTVGDVAMRPDGNLFAFSVGLNAPIGPTDANSGNLLQIDTGDGTATNLNDDGIETFQLDDDGAVERSNDGEGDGIQFNAMTFGDIGGLQLFGAGERGMLGLPGPEYDTNILYWFYPTDDPNNDPPAFTAGMARPLNPLREDDEDFNGAFTNVFERGQILTDIDVGGGNTVLMVVAATATDQGATIFQIPDGLTFSVDGAGFEMNSGPEVRLTFDQTAGEFFREGDRFTLDGSTFEFDTGPVLTFTGTGSTLVDSDTFVLDGLGFELEDELIGNGVAPGNTAIPFNANTTVGNFRQSVVDAINTAGGGGFDVRAVDVTGRVTLINDSSLTFSPGYVGITQNGDYGPQFGGTTIAVEETSTPAEVRTAIVNRFTTVGGITASSVGERINFEGAINGDFGNALYMVDQGSDGNVGGGNTPVGFLASDTAADIAVKIADAINAATAANATAANAVVTLTAGTFTAAMDPLVIGGAAPGGTVTGLAIVAGQLYAVSDAGGLFQIGNPTSDAITTDYIETGVDLLGIEFSGLSVGPPNAEDGRYAEMLFGIDAGGDVYAFNTDGELQGIFVDGQTSVQTGVAGAHGLAFSTLDENLWHTSFRRAGDPGHDGGLSLHFGDANPELADNKNYDFPGGSHGSMISNPFSLEGYSGDDVPMIYFNYFLITEGAAGQMRDSLRVFVSDDTREDGRGQWHLLATNNPAELGVDLDPMDDINIQVQRLFDNTWEDVPDLDDPMLPRNGQRDPHLDEGEPDVPRLPRPSEEDGVWRQARISLADFAGSDSLRVRFDFATAGSIDVGNPQTAGSDLHAIEGSRLRDADVFVIDGVDFEFEMGLTLNVPAGSTFTEGETLTIDDGVNPVVTYEFTNGDPVPGNIAIPINPDATAGEVALDLTAAIVADGPAGVVPHLVGNRLNLEGAVGVTQSADPAIFVEGAVGTVGIPVLVHSEMTPQEVVEAIVPPIADEFAGGNVDVVKTYDYFVRIIGHTVDDPGPLGLSDVLPGDAFGVFFQNLRGQDNTSVMYTFEDENDNFIVPYEGPYIDDLIIGFASRGEAVTDLRPVRQAQTSCLWVPDDQKPCTPTIDGLPVPVVDRAYFVPEFAEFTPTGNFGIEVGEYQFEIRRSAEYTVGGQPIRTFDPKDRLSQSVTLYAPAGVELFDGQTFSLNDGLQTVTFEYDDMAIADGVAPEHVAVPFEVSDRDFLVAERIRTAINSAGVQAILAVKAAAPDGTAVGPDSTGSNQINLFGNLAGDPLGIDFLVNDEVGSTNRFRDQGQLLIVSNQISDSLMYGVVVEDGLRDLPMYLFSGPDDAFFPRQQHAQFTTGDYTPHSGPARNTREPNQDSLTPGVTITNNVIAAGGQGGIHFGGNRNGFVIIAPIGGDRPEAPFIPVTEVWDTDAPNAPMTFSITDNNGLTVEFEFEDGRDNNGVLPGNVPVIFEPNDGCPGLPNMGACMPRYHATFPDMAEALVDAISSTNLDVTIIQGRYDELFIEGAIDVRGVQLGGARPIDWFTPWYYAVPEGGRPYGRILNNTLIGKGGQLYDEHDLDEDGEPVPDNVSFQDVGILIEDNAAPTLLNNIVVNFDTAVAADISSTTTVQGGTIFQGSNANLRNIDIGDFAIELDEEDSLFVDFVAGNYIPAVDSPAIDSSIDSLEDRPEFVRVREPLGIPVSPVLAPNDDVTGQLRVDDPDVEPPAGIGENVFKDRGAIDRADFAGPTAVLITPRDNDAEGNDLNPAETVVQLPSGVILTQFSIQLDDGVGPADPSQGTGVDPASVTSSTTVVTRRNLTTSDVVTLEPDVDYTFSYDVTNSVIRLTPLAGVWESNSGYTIRLDNSFATGIHDIAGNPLKANQIDGQTIFGITLGGLRDFGDAPDPSFPTLRASGGAQHEIINGMILGTTITSELDGQPSIGADADAGDDGVVFDTALLVGIEVTLTVTASTAGRLDAWIDFDGDGTWNQPGDQIFTSQLLIAGPNSLTIDVPRDALAGPSYARFRFSGSGGLAPTGVAEDGEVEDYLVPIFGNPWQNSPNPLNIDNDPNDSVDPIDALVIINELNNPRYSDPITGELPVPPPIPPGSTEGAPFFYDADGDGFVAPVDALMVINFLNAASQLASTAVAAVAEDDLPVDLTPVQTVVTADLPAESPAVSPPVVVAQLGDNATRPRARRTALDAVERADRLAYRAEQTARRDAATAERHPVRATDRGTMEFDTAVTAIAEEIDTAAQSNDPHEAIFARLA